LFGHVLNRFGVYADSGLSSEGFAAELQQNPAIFCVFGCLHGIHQISFGKSARRLLAGRSLLVHIFSERSGGLIRPSLGLAFGGNYGILLGRHRLLPMFSRLGKSSLEGFSLMI